MSENKDKKSCCPEKVEALINNKSTKFSEEDRKFLEQYDADTLDKLFPVEQPKKEEEPAPVENKKKDDETSKEEAVNLNSLKTTDDWMKIMPAEMQDQVRVGLQLNKRYRTKLIEEIGNDAFSNEELGDMQTNHLERLAKLAGKEVDMTDYSAMRTAKREPATYTEEPMLPAGLVSNEKKDDK